MKNLIALFAGLSMAFFVPFSATFFVLETTSTDSYEGTREDISTLAWAIAFTSSLSVLGMGIGSAAVLNLGSNKKR